MYFLEQLSVLFSYSFIQRALVVGILVSLCAALLGISLVLRRFSMIGDGLSHVGFGALSVAYALSAAPMAVIPSPMSTVRTRSAKPDQGALTS